METLCYTCESFRKWDVWNDEAKRETFEGARFAHYASGSALEASADKRCHLCILLRQSLYQSRRPSEDDRLPDRQVYISVRLPDLLQSTLTLSVKIQPASLHSAGKHDLDEMPDSPNYFSLRNLRTKEELEKAFEAVDSFPFDNQEALWYATWAEKPDGEDDVVYCLGKKRISEDGYYALALPYYTGFIDLNSVGGTHCTSEN
jgi:hypothetical protein